MRTAPLLLTAALITPLAWAGDVQLRASAGRIDLTATAAPLQDVLARLSQQTGMKVVYDGTPPRALVTVTLQQRTPAEVVLTLFDGSGINYALATDKSGTNVSMLIVSGAASGTATPARSVAAPPPMMVPGADRRVPVRPQPPPDAERAEERDDEQPADETQAKPQPMPTPPVPVIFQGPIPGPGRPGSPFGGQIGPLTLPTPAPPGGPPPLVPPSPSPTPSPGPSA